MYESEQDKHESGEAGRPAGEAERMASPEEVRLRPRIYVASLADYNAGRRHGVRLDAVQDEEDLQAGVTAMLETSPEPIAEEWAIQDYEGFGSVRLGEYESLATISAVARGIAEHGQAFAAWASYQDGLSEVAPDGF